MKANKNFRVENAPFFLPEFVEAVKVVKVYDGDTIHVVGAFKDSVKKYKWSVRLKRIDTPEIKNEVTHNRACFIRDKLAEKILNKLVRLEHIEHDKYGRLLAEVFLGEENISDWVLSQNYGVTYSGGKKVDWNTLDM
jgi:micrococcal nuclease